MPETVILPKQGLQMTEGLISKWLVDEGEEVTAGKPLFEMETDKLTITIDAQVNGTLLKILHPAGDTVEITKPIAIIGDPGDQTDNIAEGDTSDTTSVSAVVKVIPSMQPTQSHSKNATVTQKILSTPLARTTAKSLGIEISTIEPTGPLGVIVERDVISAKEKVMMYKDNSSLKMHNSHTVEVFLDEIQKFQDIIISHGVKIGYSDFIIFATLKVVKQLNMFDNDSDKIAVFSPDGGVFLTNYDILSMRALVSTRQEGQTVKTGDDIALTIHDFSFTGVDYSTICTGGLSLSIGSVRKGVRVEENDSIKVADMLTLTISFDPGCYDGFVCANFLGEIALMLKEPLSMLC